MLCRVLIEQTHEPGKSDTKRNLLWWSVMLEIIVDSKSEILMVQEVTVKKNTQRLSWCCLR